MNLDQCIRDEIAKAVAAAIPVAKTGQSPVRVGNTVYIRTVTHHYTGRIVALDAQEIVLVDAAWVVDSGRWADAIATGTLNEVEPYLDGVTVAVNRGAVCDVCDWTSDLPRVQK